MIQGSPKLVATEVVNLTPKTAHHRQLSGTNGLCGQRTVWICGIFGGSFFIGCYKVGPYYL